MEKANKKATQAQFSKQEKIRYLVFLIAKKQKFMDKCLSRQIYEQMNSYISADRGYKQCFNFHDRMKRKYGSYENIVKQLKQVLQVHNQTIEKQAFQIKQKMEGIINQCLLLQSHIVGQNIFKRMKSMTQFNQPIQKKEILKEQTQSSLLDKIELNFIRTSSQNHIKVHMPKKFGIIVNLKTQCDQTV